MLEPRLSIRFTDGNAICFLETKARIPLRLDLANTNRQLVCLRGKIQAT